MLNRILEMDALENYFTYSISGNKLDIYFTSEYERALLKDEKINHIAWILTSPNIFKMCKKKVSCLKGLRGKKFSRLSDRITRRKYAIGKVIMMNGREFSLIDVEREDKALYMFILKANNLVKWKQIYIILLIRTG